MMMPDEGMLSKTFRQISSGAHGDPRPCETRLTPVSIPVFEWNAANCVEGVMKPILRPWPVLGAAALLLTGCLVEERPYGRRHVVVRETVVASAPAPGTEIIVREAAPAPRTEVVMVSPGPAYVWVPGYWAWHNRWVWEGGHWALPPRPGAVWVPHRYVFRGGVHVYVHGGWRF